MNKRWFEMSEPELEKELSTSAVNGLSKKAAANRRKRDGGNYVFRLPHGSFSSYLKEIFSDSTAVILVLAALISAVFQNTVIAYVIAGIILVNSLVVIFTYIKAHRVLEGMGEYSLPGAKVIRDGHLYLVSMNSLVKGDLIYLKSGDIVPADARIIGAEGFFVSESGITGNKSPVRKSPQNVSPDNDSNENMFNMVFASSVVLKGTARAIVVETGDKTLVSLTNNSLLNIEQDNLNIFAMLRNYGSKISMLMLVMVFVLMFLEIITGLNNRGIYEIFIGGMSLAVAAMTEFYTAFGYIIVACGLFGARTNKQKHHSSVILKNINSIEKLKDINCVIFRKDGFLTEKNKVVDVMYASGQLYRVSDYDREDDGFKYLLEGAAVSTGVYMKGTLSAPGTVDRELNQDEDAILDCVRKYGLYNIELNNKYPLILHKTTADYQYSYSVVREADTNTDTEKSDVILYVRCAARKLLDKCTSYCIGQTNIPIDRALKNNLLSIISEYEKTNTSIYAITVKHSKISTVLSENYEISNENNYTLIGFIVMRSPLIDGCAQAVSRLTESGIKLVVNSPMSLNEDIISAKNLGICKKDADILDERILSVMNEDNLNETVDSYSVYMGLKNESQRKVIAALKNKGYNVAYCADSLTDISVMECADIGYTYSNIPDKTPLNKVKSGLSKKDETSDALKFKSDVIIPVKNSRKHTEGGILSIEKSILTSKLIYVNLMDLFAYFVSVQFARLFIVLYSVFTQLTMLSPIQILIGGLTFDFLAVLVIAFTKPSEETNNDYILSNEYMSSFLKYMFKYALFGVFWAAMTIFVPKIVGIFSNDFIPSELASVSFISFILTQFIALIEVRTKMSIFRKKQIKLNPVLTALFLLMLIFIGISMLIPSVGSIVGIVVPDTKSLLSIFLIVVSVLGLHESYKSIIKKA